VPKGLHRIQDFARWVIRAEERLPWEPGRFMAANARSLDDVAEETLVNDPVALILVDMLRIGGVIQGSKSAPAHPLRSSASRPPRQW
jgi:hypothetical protein